jgi:hypothetical protein
LPILETGKPRKPKEQSRGAGEAANGKLNIDWRALDFGVTTSG